MFWRESIIGVPVAISIPMWAVLCQLSIDIEKSRSSASASTLEAAVDAIRLDRRTLANIKGNLFWAFAYNVAAIPLAALGLLNQTLAGAAMAFSSVFVVSNSLRLPTFPTHQPSRCRQHPHPPHPPFLP